MISRTKTTLPFFRRILLRMAVPCVPEQNCCVTPIQGSADCACFPSAAAKFLSLYMQRADYLIAGQGIAGSVLAQELMQKGKSVIVFDRPELSSSSKVAAGAWNPFNFRRMVNNWRAAELLEEAKRFYAALESWPGQVVQSLEVMKIFSGPDERRLWENAVAADPSLFASPHIAESPFPEIIDAPQGIGLVREAGRVDTGMLMHLVREKLLAKQALYQEIFDPSRLVCDDEGIVYDNRVRAGRMIFCEGHLARHNPFFDRLPIIPVKGQVLHVHIPGLRLTNIVNRGVYLLPQGEELFTAGATFENGKDNEDTDAAAEEELLGKLKKFIRVPVRVESRYAGVRPAVKDRRPLLGKHPRYAQLFVFNGFGSKGVFFAPWLAKRMTDLMEEGLALPADVSIERFADYRVQ